VSTFRTPLHALSQGDLRLLVSQKIGLRYTVPKALESICGNVLLEADLYPGDLLCALLRIDKDYWSENPTELNWLVSMARSAANQYGKIVRECASFLTANSGHRQTLN
jgi:CDI immunity proteins